MIQATPLLSATTPPDAKPAMTSPSGPAPADAPPEGMPLSGRQESVPIGRIRPDPDQPRKEPIDTEEFANLVESMRDRRVGQLVPIIVRHDWATGDYIIIEGECRWRAAQEAGLRFMGCVVRAGVDPGDILELQLVANNLRVVLHPLDQARAFRRLMDDKGLNQKQLAQRLKLSESRVSRVLATLKVEAPTPLGDSESGHPEPVPVGEAEDVRTDDSDTDDLDSEDLFGGETPNPAPLPEAVQEESPGTSAETSGPMDEPDDAGGPGADDAPAAKLGKKRGRPSVASAVGARKSLAAWVRKQKAGDLSDDEIIDALSDAIRDVQGGTH